MLHHNVDLGTISHMFTYHLYIFLNDISVLCILLLIIISCVDVKTSKYFFNSSLSFNLFFKIFYLYLKRRFCKEKEVLPWADSLPKWLQQLESSWSEARSLFRVSHMGIGSKGLGSSFTAFSGHKQKGGSDVQ